MIRTTGLGLVISMPVQTQVAAMITSIVTIIPAVLYSGPAAALSSLRPAPADRPFPAADVLRPSSPTASPGRRHGASCGPTRWCWRLRHRAVRPGYLFHFKRPKS